MKLEDQLRDTMRFKHLSLKTEESYVGWYRRYVLWHGKKHPADMGAEEVEAFLTHLAVERKLAASSQNQALNALVFLYREVLKVDLKGVDAQRAKYTKRLPTVLTQNEVAELLKAVKGEAGLLCKLLYGCGLRVAEGLALRVKDVDLNGGTVTVRGGKGDKDRIVTLPKTLLQPITEHRARVELIYKQDRANGLGGVYLPNAMAVKEPAAVESWEWYWLFDSHASSGVSRPAGCLAAV